MASGQLSYNMEMQFCNVYALMIDTQDIHAENIDLINYKSALMDVMAWCYKPTTPPMLTNM